MNILFSPTQGVWYLLCNILCASCFILKSCLLCPLFPCTSCPCDRLPCPWLVIPFTCPQPLLCLLFDCKPRPHCFHLCLVPVVYLVCVSSFFCLFVNCFMSLFMSFHALLVFYFPRFTSKVHPHRCFNSGQLKPSPACVRVQLGLIEVSV